MSRFFRYEHAGDLGDVIYQAVPAMRYACGDLCLWRAPKMVREPFCREKVERVRSFFELQPGVGKVYFRDTPERDDFINVSLDAWRKKPVPRTQTLTDCALLSLRRDPWKHDESWLVVDGAESVAPFVFNRTPRYNTPDFPWKAVADKWRSEAVFVGTEREHSNFQAMFGKVKYHPTPTLLDLARVIAGCRLFVGNQSTPLALAHGLGMPVYVEEDRYSRNCHFVRKRAWYGALQWRTIEP